MTTQLDISVEDGPVRRVQLVGELDVDSAKRCGPQLETAISAGDPGLVVVELAGLTFCDSSGVRALLGMHRRAQDLGRDLRVHGAAGSVAEVLRLTGVDRILQAPDGDQAH
jgi:anti-sigma B factor antagonist